jgi:hypothetical protein
MSKSPGLVQRLLLPSCEPPRAINDNYDDFANAVKESREFDKTGDEQEYRSHFDMAVEAEETMGIADDHLVMSGHTMRGQHLLYLAACLRGEKQRGCRRSGSTHGGYGLADTDVSALVLTLCGTRLMIHDVIYGDFGSRQSHLRLRRNTLSCRNSTFL